MKTLRIVLLVLIIILVAQLIAFPIIISQENFVTL
jgi:hypothetical protein